MERAPNQEAVLKILENDKNAKKKTDCTNDM